MTDAKSCESGRWLRSWSASTATTARTEYARRAGDKMEDVTFKVVQSGPKMWKGSYFIGAVRGE